MTVQMKLSRIILNEIRDEQFIFLKEVDGDRQFPIVIGPYEARSIDLRVKRFQHPRPQSHDLLVSVVEQMGGKLDSVVITELRDRTYYARLRIRRNGQLIEVDSRPSDAIAVAVTCDPALPIFVAEEVVDAAHDS